MDSSEIEPELTNARVFVGNLPWSITDEELNEHMCQAGEVVSATVIRDSSGRSRGGGIVEFSSMDEARNAIETLNDEELGGRPLLVREDRETETPISRESNGDGDGEGDGGGQTCRVYVGNLAWEVAWQDLKDHMRQAGEVTRSDVMSEPDGRSKGCGIVEYTNPEDAATAIETLTDTELMGRSIFVREDREERRGRGTGTVGGQGTHVYVGNLPEDCTWQDVKDHMRQAGNVTHVKMPEDEEGNHKGFAIVEMDTNKSSARAIRELNNSFIKNTEIHVREDREQRRGGRGRGRGRRW